MPAALKVRDLLIRGMAAGIFAGLLALGFAAVFGEPEIDNAIAVEQANAEALPHANNGDESSPVSRATQKTFGLATGIGVFGVAIGGVFALVFAAVQGRIGAFRPRTTAALLAAAAYVTVVLVPFIKYPATPPAVGDAETIEKRTALYVAMIAISLAAAMLSWRAGHALVPRLGAWNAAVAGGALFITIVAGAQLLLPGVNEAGEFPADILWRFRLASLGTHLVLWAALGLSFGALVERSLLKSSAHMRSTGVPASPGGVNFR